MAAVKSLTRVCYKAIDKEVYFCDIHFKIMTNNIMPEHIRLLGIPYKYTIKNVKHYLFDSASHWNWTYFLKHN